MQVKESSGAETRENVQVTAAEVHDIPNSRGQANFLLKWSKDARHAAYLNVVQLKGVTCAYTAADSEAQKWVPLVAFECRGMEPFAWQPQVGLVMSD